MESLSGISIGEFLKNLPTIGAALRAGAIANPFEPVGSRGRPAPWPGSEGPGIHYFVTLRDLGIPLPGVAELRADSLEAFERVLAQVRLVESEPDPRRVRGPRLARPHQHRAARCGGVHDRSGVQ